MSSGGTLNLHKGSSNMNKRSLIVMMLIGLLGVGMVTGCKTEPGETPRTVEAKYRGTWVSSDQPGTTGQENLIISEQQLLTASQTYTAWTDGTSLYVGSDIKIGVFQSNTALLFDREVLASGGQSQWGHGGGAGQLLYNKQ
jgi:hypothetical protein